MFNLTDALCLSIQSPTLVFRSTELSLSVLEQEPKVLFFRSSNFAVSDRAFEYYMYTHTHWHFMHWQFTSHSRIVFTINQQVSHSKWISNPLYRWDSSQTQTHCSVLFNAETACCCLLDSVETGQIVSIVLLHTERKDFPCFHCHMCVCGTFNSHVGFTWLLFSFCLENNCMCVCKCVITQMVVELRNAKAANREIGVRERERARMCFARLLIRNWSRDHPVALVTAVLNCR